MSRRCFIAGSEGAGTSCLQRALATHQELACLDPLDSYLVLSGRSAPVYANKLLVLHIPSLSEQLDWAEPSAFGLRARLAPFYRGERVVFLVRDFEGTVAALLKPCAGRSRIDDIVIPYLRRKADSDVCFARRWQRELELCARTGSKAAYGALYWAHKNEALFRYLRYRYPVLPLGFEALLRAPRFELSRTLRFLGATTGSMVRDEIDVEGEAGAPLSSQDASVASVIASPIAREVRNCLGTRGFD